MGESQHHFDENVIVAGTSYQNNVRGFIILQSGEGLTFPSV